MKKMTNEQKIGYLLQKYREDNNYSQQYVADKLNKHKSTISLWESGKRSINMSDFIELIETMGYDKKSISKDISAIIFGKND